MAPAAVTSTSFSVALSVTNDRLHSLLSVLPPKMLSWASKNPLTAPKPQTIRRVGAAVTGTRKRGPGILTRSATRDAFRAGNASSNLAGVTGGEITNGLPAFLRHARG